MEENKSLTCPGINQSTKEVVDQIVTTQDPTQLKQLTDLFNMNISKKNIVRALKYSVLLDNIADQIIERFTARPDMFTNEELLRYMQAVQSIIDKSNQDVTNLSNAPIIQINQQQVNVTLGPQLDRDSKERVADAVNAVLARIQEAKQRLNDDIVMEDENATNK